MSSGFWSASSPAAPFFLPEDVVLRGKASRKKLRWAYLRWLLLGSHYLYLRRPFTQILFWATLGGLLLWWLIDLTRIGTLVRKHNERALSRLMEEYRELLDRQVLGEPPQASRPEPAPPEQRATPEFLAAPGADRRASDFEARPAAVLLLSSALVASVALYVFNPPRLFPDADRSPGEILAFGPFP
jgi:hypothetical protein